MNEVIKAQAVYARRLVKLVMNAERNKDTEAVAQIYVDAIATWGTDIANNMLVIAYVRHEATLNDAEYVADIVKGMRQVSGDLRNFTNAFDSLDVSSLKVMVGAIVEVTEVTNVKLKKTPTERVHLAQRTVARELRKASAGRSNPLFIELLNLILGSINPGTLRLEGGDEAIYKRLVDLSGRPELFWAA